MTARAEYTVEEWDLLRYTPYAAGMAVVLADGMGVFETVREFVAVVVDQAGGMQRYPGNELIKSLLTDRTTGTAQSAAREDMAGVDPADIPEHLLKAAIEQCGRVVALLNERSREVERDGYLHWIMDAARAAAVATRHGGLFSREPLVDAPEGAALREIAAALGVEVGELPTGDASSAPEPGSAGEGATPPSPDAVPGNADVPSGPITPE